MQRPSWLIPRRRIDIQAVTAIALTAALVLDRLRLLATFGVQVTDEDQTLLWYVTRDLAHGHLWEPYFFGQTYGSWFESVVALPLERAGVALRIALPAAGALLGTAPWLLLALLAWRREARGTALLTLAAGAGMAFEGSIIGTLPRGLLPGIVLGVVAVVVALWPGRWSRSVGVAFAYGLLVLLGAGYNQGSALVTAPVTAFLVLRGLGQRAWRWRVGAGGGAATGGAFHLWALAFYHRHPSLDLHPAPSLGFDAHVLRQNASHPGRHLAAYAPELLRTSALPLLALAAVVALVLARRRLPEGAAAAVAVLLTVGVLATPKSLDGTPSVLLPYSRVFLAFPFLVIALAVLAARPERTASDRARVVIAAVALAIGAAGIADRQLHWHDRIAAIEAVAARGPHVLPADTAALDRTCAALSRAARAAGAGVVVERYDRVAAYGCGAERYGRLRVVFPGYERRPWLLGRHDGSPLLVAEAEPAGCAAAPVDCEPLPGSPSLSVVRGYTDRLELLLDRIGSPP